jgi:transposase
MADELRRVTVGIDTHADIHVARAKDDLGRRLGELQIPTTPAGYRLLLAWAKHFGDVRRFGIEGTGSWGAGLARYLRSKGEVVLEVSRPNRQHRRRRGKSDPTDADAAASAVLAGDALGMPKAQDGAVEAVRILRVARRGAVKAKTNCIHAMRSLVVTAPSELREQLRGMTRAKLVSTCARFRSSDDPREPLGASKAALRSLALRHQALDAEIKVLDRQLGSLVTHIAPDLVARGGIKTASAGALLVAAGDNPGRLRGDAAFAALCGSSPVEASSGKVRRHRLNRGGDRDANAALYRIVVNRLSWESRTMDYMARRLAEGKSKREIIRCLKRYVAREVYGLLRSSIQQNSTTAAA